MISVIIPIYNAAQYLSRTIQCLREQVYTDFEVLLIDDGSKDDSAQICREIVKADPRFRYAFQENRGVSAARNHGLNLSRGDYIAFIDADDMIPENYLGVLLEALLKKDGQMSVCDVVIMENNRETTRFTCAEEMLGQRETLNFLLSRRNINSGPCAKLFRREILCGIAFPLLRAYEDILFVIEAVCCCERIAITDRTEYRYIQNSGSAMSGFARMPSADIITATDKILDFLQTRNDLDPMCVYITISHLMQYVLPLCDREEAGSFIGGARYVFRKNWKEILRCRAFPWKEKITYSLFICGWIYQDRKIRRLK